MDKNKVPDNFTIQLAFVDALPVLFFGMNCILLGQKCSSHLFTIGAILCLAGGAGKVLWKIIVALKKKNVWFLFVQMRIVMPIGFILMILGFFLSNCTFTNLWQGFIHFPSIIFYLLGIFGMGLMGYFATHLDNSDLKSNWIEQITNGISQICIFIGLII